MATQWRFSFVLSISYRGRCVVPLLSSELANGGVGRARARSWSGCPILENLTVSFSQIHRTYEATREISETVAADYSGDKVLPALRDSDKSRESALEQGVWGKTCTDTYADFFHLGGPEAGWLVWSGGL